MADDDDGIDPGDDIDRVVAYKYVAKWTWSGADKSTDKNAEFFGGPAWPENHGSIVPDGPPKGFWASLSPWAPAKLVDYVPVKRRNGQDVFPTLSVSIKLTNQKGAQTARVRDWVGTSVEVTVVNVLPGNSDKKNQPGELTLSLRGKLDSNLSCEIQIPRADVESWLKKDSPLKAVVNENLLDFRFKMTGVLDGGNPLEGQAQRRLFLYCRKTVVLVPGLFASQVQFQAAHGQIVGFPDFFDDALLKASNDDPYDSGGAAIAAMIPNLSQNAEVLECDDKGVPLIPCAMPTLLMLEGMVIDPFTDLHDARVALLPHVPENFRLYTLIVSPYDWRGDLTDASAALVNQVNALQNGPVKDPKGTSLRGAPDTDDQVVIIGHSTGGLLIRRALAKIAAKDCTDPSKAPPPDAPSADTLISLAFFLSVPFSGAPKAGAVLLTGCETPEGSPMIPFIKPESLVSIALTMPIVYHLHTSLAYQHRPATSPSAPLKGLNADLDKSTFVLDAMIAGLLPEGRAVDARQAKDDVLRKNIALSSGNWHQFVRDFHEISSGRSYKNECQITPWDRGGWYSDEIKKRGLQQQDDLRGATGWNTYLADRARAFHAASATAISGVWKDRTAIFWGSCETEYTFRQLNLLRFGREQPTYYQIADFERSHRITDFNRGSYGLDAVTPLTPELGYEGGRRDFTQYRRNLILSSTVAEIFWRMAWVRQLGAGDGTVPTDSQLAEQPNVHATYTTIAPDEVGRTFDFIDPPTHSNSTKSPYVWQVLVAAIHAGQLADEDPKTTADRATYMDRLTHPTPPGMPFYGP